LWGLTAKKAVVSGDTFRFLEWFCALVVGFIAFEVVNKLVQEKLSVQLGKISSAPPASNISKVIARFTKGLGSNSD
jgi:hypothetical protein